jgi:hypothetical protein
MKGAHSCRGKSINVSADAASAKVAAAAASLDLNKEQALAIAKAEPRNAAVFAGVSSHPAKKTRVRPYACTLTERI